MRQLLRLTRLVVVLVLTLVARPITAQQLEDVIYLKDGSVLRGVITEQIPGQSVLIQTRDGNIFRVTVDRIARMTRETRPQASSASGQKSGATAFLLSFLIPGTGQFYNEQFGKGAVQLVGASLGAAVSFGTWFDCWEDDVDCAEWSVGTAMWLGSWLWSMIDAPASAAAINRRSIALEFGPRVTVARGPALSAPGSGLPLVRRRLGMNVGLARITF